MAPKALYAEDELSNRKLMEVHFKKHGIDIDLAGDGKTAMKMIEKHRYDLILLDHYMPGANGDEVARHVRKFWPDVPMVAITSDDIQVDNLLEAGFNEVLIKPLVGGSYMETILGLLKGQAGSR